MMTQPPPHHSISGVVAKHSHPSPHHNEGPTIEILFPLIILIETWWLWSDVRLGLEHFVSHRLNFMSGRATMTRNFVRHLLSTQHRDQGLDSRMLGKYFQKFFSIPTTNLLDPNWRDDSHSRLDVGLVFVVDFKLFRSPDKTRSDPSGRDRPARSHLTPHTSHLISTGD